MYLLGLRMSEDEWWWWDGKLWNFRGSAGPTLQYGGRVRGSVKQRDRTAEDANWSDNGCLYIYSMDAGRGESEEMPGEWIYYYIL